VNTEDRIDDFMAVGLDSKFATRVARGGYTLEKIISSSEKDLRKDFENWEVEKVREAAKRKPIPKDTVSRLVKESDWKCCICWDIDKEAPIIIHHIEDYSRTKDNGYENLVILCLNHHALAHSNWQISQHPLPKELIRERKQKWIRAVSEYKKGLRPPPGRESADEGVFSHGDKEALDFFRSFVDRPAIHQPFRIEGNMHDFLEAITDIIRALNTGIMKTREGDEIARTKPRSMLSNPDWSQKLEIIAHRFEDLRTRFQVAVRGNELILRPNGNYCFINQELPGEIDAMRDSIVLLFNELLREANLNPISSVRRPRMRHI
jgi:hypothetical protein